MMLEFIWISLGGALGTAARILCTGFVDRYWGETFPWGTLLVNVTGSLAIGFIATLAGTEGRLFRQFFMIGVLGGYTTFSAFSLQTLNLSRSGEWLKAGGNVLISVGMCLLAVWIGHALAVSMNSTK